MRGAGFAVGFIAIVRATAFAQTATVTGVVYDSVRGMPLAGAMVVVEGTAMAVRSDGEGRFVIDSVAAGRAILAVESEALDSLGVGIPPVRIAVEAGARMSVVLALPSARTIIAAACAGEDLVEGEGLVSGVVRDALSRAPVARASIELEWDVWVLDGAQLVSRRTGMRRESAVDGAFIACAVPSEALVWLRAAAGGRSSGRVEVRMPRFAIVRQDLDVGSAEGIAPQVATTSAPRTAPPAVGAERDPDRDRRRGAGSVVDHAAIEARGSVAVPELLRGIPGVAVQATATGAHAAWTRARASCTPRYFVDGVLVSESMLGRSDDVESLELFAPGMAPSKYGGARSTCAVVLIWTRRATPGSTAPP